MYNIILTDELINNILIFKIKNERNLFITLEYLKKIVDVLPREVLYELYIFILNKYKCNLSIDYASISNNINLLDLLLKYKNNKRINLKYSTIGFYNGIKENNIKMLKWWVDKYNNKLLKLKFNERTLKYTLCESSLNTFKYVFDVLKLKITKIDLIKLIKLKKFDIIYYLYYKVNLFKYLNDIDIIKQIVLTNNIYFLHFIHLQNSINNYINYILLDKYIYNFISLEMIKYLNSIEKIYINIGFLSYASRIDILNWYDSLENNITNNELEQYIFNAVVLSNEKLLKWIYLKSLKNNSKYKIIISTRIFNIINNNTYIYRWFLNRELI